MTMHIKNDEIVYTKLERQFVFHHANVVETHSLCVENSMILHDCCL